MAIVKLHDATVQQISEVVLRDYADPANPRTVCRFAQTNSRIVQVIDARHVVIEHSGAYAVVDLPDVSYHWFQLPSGQEGVNSSFIAVSPGLDSVLWTSTEGDYNVGRGTRHIHITTASSDEVVASIPVPLGGRCGSPEDSRGGAYTHSGMHAFALDQPIAGHNALVAFEGMTAMLSVIPGEAGWDDGQDPAMAAWSPTAETLYYRQGNDVWRWTPGSDPTVFLAGVKWYHPTFSPNGRHIAYAVPREDGPHDVYLVNLDEGSGPQLIGQSRNQPTFLNDEQLWYRSEGEAICGPGGDMPLIYSLTDSLEAPSVIDQVIGTWPATGSNQ